MCGIGGWVGRGTGGFHAPQLAAMLEAMRHRGPDDTGVFVEESGQVGLGHNRLSIIDLSADGHQPMINRANGDVLVFNGEIYNFRELRSELKTRGWSFRSRSDTEVLLNAFGEWGVECLSRLDGMYAFALWRPREQALYLARDPLGIKPLYYRRTAGTGEIIFASEIGALLACPGVRPSADRRALGEFLEFGYTFDDERTCLEGVCKLPPGHVLKLTGEPSVIAPTRFYVPDLTLDTSTDIEATVEELHATLQKVVKEHLVADVPVGLLLSGGLDSSILAALAAKETRVRTLSMGFANSKLDERSEARRVAQFIGSEHEEILITPQEIKQAVFDAAKHFDDLFADWGMISTRLLYAKCRERGLKVVLVGEGSDELFGGYEVFRKTSPSVPRLIWLAQLYRTYCGRRHGDYFAAFREIMNAHLQAVGGDRFAAIRLFESRQQLPNNYVQKVDKASMSVSVEARTPFLDRRVAAIAYRTPGSRLLAENSEKILLRQVAQRYGLLPEETSCRRKLGGSIAASWMDDDPDWRGFARAKILDGRWTRELGLGAAMNAYFVENRDGYRFPRAISVFRNLAWRLLILELWSDAQGVAPHAA